MLNRFYIDWTRLEYIEAFIIIQNSSVIVVLNPEWTW